VLDFTKSSWGWEGGEKISVREFLKSTFEVVFSWTGSFKPVEEYETGGDSHSSDRKSSILPVIRALHRGITTLHGKPLATFRYNDFTVQTFHKPPLLSEWIQHYYSAQC